MKLIFCLWFIFIVLIFQILSKNAQASIIERNYAVEVTTENGPKIYSSYEANEYIALTKTEALIRMSSLVGDLKNVKVVKTGLDFSKLPVVEFLVVGSRGSKIVPLHTTDSKVGILAIQEAHRKNYSHLELELGVIKEIQVIDKDLIEEQNRFASTCLRSFR